MASTSMTLGSHWEAFIRDQVGSGRYGSASEVIRDALRQMEERQSKLEALREHLSHGMAQAQRGEFSDLTPEGIKRQLDLEDQISDAGIQNNE
ncbi:type II toxin-antitoxin system ParD family antitoxin (plasmid) [Microbulbifer sp. CnH-101-G]|uniref:type II toxin-antitoxin system ParD family antitoxin n=1 Tax=Microbulbifer sp. CnH-101-G TaxID=3243393 RepID=UPI00403961D4